MAQKADAWLAVSREGLAKVAARRGKFFALAELISNAWDEETSVVTVELRPLPGKAQAEVVVSDAAPDGFKNLTHAYTLFAESEKKNDPLTRGRFNLGEKLVLALAREATIFTTTGTVRFRSDGTRTVDTRKRREYGSEFRAILHMTREELDEVLRQAQRLISPAHIQTVINRVQLPHRTPITTFEHSLMTDTADPEGNLRRTHRTTKVEVYAPAKGETAMIYELGVPVVETGDRYHVNVMQKVPLTMERDNVPPSFLRELRAGVFNATYETLGKPDMTTTWVREAASDPCASPLAVKRSLDLRFGEKAVSFDPSDPEANKRAVAAGYTVISGGSLSAGEWDNAKRLGLLPAGQVTPSAKPFQPGGRPVNVVDPANYTADQADIVGYATTLGRYLLGIEIEITICSDFGWSTAACFGPDGHLYFNVARLGHAWFRRENVAGQHELLLHEFAHLTQLDHLDDKFADEIARLGVKLVALAQASSAIVRVATVEFRVDPRTAVA